MSRDPLLRISDSLGTGPNTLDQSWPPVRAMHTAGVQQRDCGLPTTSSCDGLLNYSLWSLMSWLASGLLFLAIPQTSRMPHHMTE